MAREIAFQMATSNIRFGAGVTREVGMDLKDMNLRKVMVIVDPGLKDLPPVTVALQSLEDERVSFCLFDGVRIEPTDESIKEAITAAQELDCDGFLAIGGGSTIDTAKAANLYFTYPADFLDYVNAPIGKGRPVPGDLKPLIAIPTTAGTGSETTGVAIFDLMEIRAKTGIADRRLKPTLGLLDPENTRSMPSQVGASTGLDVLSHALESYTAVPFGNRSYPERPLVRPAYQGSNPISDVWSLEALRIVSQYLPRAVEDATDDEARSQMLLAASYAGVGFGNAGVHLPHGMSYPVSGMVRDYRPSGYSADYPIVPHGISVILNAPAVFRFTAPACPERHLEAARILGAASSSTSLDDAGHILSDQIVGMMQRLKIPNGLRAIGYAEEDIPLLVEGTIPQHRVTKLSPRPTSREELAKLFEEALVAW